jgi:hypothetical protein
MTIVKDQVLVGYILMGQIRHSDGIQTFGAEKPLAKK